MVAERLSNQADVLTKGNQGWVLHFSTVGSHSIPLLPRVSSTLSWFRTVNLNFHP
jgi:hypothetical protein